MCWEVISSLSNFLVEDFLVKVFLRIFFYSDNPQRKLLSKIFTDLDGIKSHPIFLETWMDLDMNYPITVQFFLFFDQVFDKKNLIFTTGTSLQSFTIFLKL